RGSTGGRGRHGETEARTLIQGRGGQGVTVFVIVLLALALLALVAAPLLLRDLSDPLPDMRDPVTVDLEEERDALLRAIHELDDRADLSAVRRDQLRTRYESKAARVLRLLDERLAQQAGQPPRERARAPRRLPWAGLALAVAFVGVAAGLGAWVLPRVGDATVTTASEAELQAGRQLRDLQQAAERSPDATNLLALGEAYWQLNDARGVAETYQLVADTISPVPAVAY